MPGNKSTSLSRSVFCGMKDPFFNLKHLKKFVCLFIYFRLPWVLVTAHRLSLAAASRDFSLVEWLLLLWGTGPSVLAQ